MPYGEASFNCLLGGYRRSARERGHAFELTREQFRELTKHDCHYCGRPPEQVYNGRNKLTNGPYVYNGVDRIDSTIGYVVGNVRPCCKVCNTAKASMTEAEFYAWVERVYERGH